MKWPKLISRADMGSCIKEWILMGYCVTNTIYRYGPNKPDRAYIALRNSSAEDAYAIYEERKSGWQSLPRRRWDVEITMAAIRDIKPGQHGLMLDDAPYDPAVFVPFSTWRKRLCRDKA